MKCWRERLWDLIWSKEADKYMIFYQIELENYDEPVRLKVNEVYKDGGGWLMDVNGNENVGIEGGEIACPPRMDIVVYRKLKVNEWDF